MPYQLDDNEIKIILPLFHLHGSQAMNLTSHQQVLDLKLRLSEALSLDGSSDLTVSDALEYGNDDTAVSNAYYILPCVIHSNFN
jgi:hypothetical protein